MANVRFGFMVFEKCTHCNSLRTYFSLEDLAILGDKYREGRHFWSRVENAQTFQFDLVCRKCGTIEKFDDLMGLLHCTGCLADCPVELLQRELEPVRTWVMVAFGFLQAEGKAPLPGHKLELLTDYFNQKRDTKRSRIKLVSFDMIADLSCCRGDFIHDVGMLSLVVPEPRKPLLGS